MERLAAVSPDLGDPDGGIQIQLHGTSLVNVLSVTVGGVPCTNVVVVRSTLVTAYTPALPAGVYAVAVTTLYGTAALVAAFESWYPTQIAGPSQVRVYDSMKGTTVAAGLLAAWADQGAGAQTTIGSLDTQRAAKRSTATVSRKPPTKPSPRASRSRSARAPSG